MRRKDILDIVKVLLDHLEEEEMCDLCGFEYEEDLWDEWDECDEWEEGEDEELDEEWEEITEHVKDNSPETLKEENEHLRNVIDMLCDVFWLEQYETNWKLGVSREKWLVEEIAKARKKLKK